MLINSLSIDRWADIQPNAAVSCRRRRIWVELLCPSKRTLYGKIGIDVFTFTPCSVATTGKSHRPQLLDMVDVGKDFSIPSGDGAAPQAPSNLGLFQLASQRDFGGSRRHHETVWRSCRGWDFIRGCNNRVSVGLLWSALSLAGLAETAPPHLPGQCSTTNTNSTTVSLSAWRFFIISTSKDSRQQYTPNEGHTRWLGCTCDTPAHTTAMMTLVWPLHLRLDGNDKFAVDRAKFSEWALDDATNLWENAWKNAWSTWSIHYKIKYWSRVLLAANECNEAYNCSNFDWMDSPTTLDHNILPSLTFHSC